MEWPDAFLRCDFFSCDPDTEYLTEREPDEAIELYLDVQPSLLDLPSTVAVFGFTRRRLGPGEPDADYILERILEDLDDEYGGGDAPSEPTPAMVTAAKELARVVNRDYWVWQCEQTHGVEVNVMEWIRANRPEELRGDKMEGKA